MIERDLLEFVCSAPNSLSFHELMDAAEKNLRERKWSEEQIFNLFTRRPVWEIMKLATLEDLSTLSRRIQDGPS